ncbi:YdcF family protein [Sphingorhabdus sp. Alg239-R122]|uniref:YdcF family protein n=1 Tax=Sphingorhabdus sp. Alg239-R122 TaxID=2305989 RepID=UPI0013DB73FB|nr:YdcF family protein [Sphingorhabdus sp. Alg239-R122]
MIIRFVSALLLLWMLGFAWFTIALPQPMGKEKTDAVVVLTGGPNRIDRGLEVLEKNWAPQMLISGVDRDVRAPELAAEYDKPLRLFSCCIDLGFDAVDTRTNGGETAAWIAEHDYKSIRLVTTDWHMRRARNEIEHALPAGVVVKPDAVRSEPTLETLFLEYHKYLFSLAAGAANI